MALFNYKVIESLILQNFEFQNLQFQMLDSHAEYYDCEIQGITSEVKVVNEDDEGRDSEYSVWSREYGREDWRYLDTVSTVAA